MRRGSQGPWRRKTIVVALIILATSLAAQAQDAGQDGAGSALSDKLAPRRPNSDDPPPLELGGAPNQHSEPKPAEPDRKPSGNHWFAYATASAKSLHDAITANNKVNTALSSSDVEFELWIDPTGRVTRVRLVKPFGDKDLDAALRDEILLKLKLPAPPSDLPMPVKERIGKR